MRILFLQNTDDSLGGIVNVNISLMQQFIKHGEDIHLISVRHSGRNAKINYPEAIQNKLINSKDEWGCPRYNVAIQHLKRGEIFSALRTIIGRWIYNIKIRKDYLNCKKEIKTINPDVIINSHYELLNAIPGEFLSATINHFHTSFDQVIENKSYEKIFRKYRDKIAKFVWLSDATCKRAIEFGFENSTHIYNPLSFSTEKITDIQQKKIVFIGRFSEEKRIGLAVRLFSEVIAENDIKDWYFDIYGTGELDLQVEELIKDNQYVSLKGSTSKVEQTLLNYSIFMLTSRFEGMALVVLEANECGLPVISFNFGESVFEEIDDGKTGYIIEQGEEREYKDKLLRLMTDVSLRSEMSGNAKEFATDFHIESIIKQWYDLFEEI